MMKSLIALEKSLIEESVTGVKDYINDIDKKTSNEAMQAMGEALGFQTMEIDGMYYAHLGRASQILGHADPSSLARLLRAYQIMTPKIGWFDDESRSRIRKTFNLDPKDSQATFVPYEGILIAGMQGQTEGSRKIKLYLLKMETAGRVCSAISTDHAKTELMQYRLQSQKAKDVAYLTAKIENMKDSPFKDYTIEALEKLTGKQFPKSAQMELPFKE